MKQKEQEARKPEQYHALESPFVNDPFAMVWMAFKKLYPDADCEVWLDHRPEDWIDGDGYGFTEFYVDGSNPMVFIYAEFQIDQQVEILGHELAHVAVGEEHEHDDVWMAAFTAINEEYKKIAEERLGCD